MEKELKEKDISKGLESLTLYNMSITVANLESAIKWYSTILNFNLIAQTSFQMPGGKVTAALISGAGVKIELLNIPNNRRICDLFAPAPYHLIPIGSKTIVFQVDDIKKASEELEAKGVRFVWREKYHTEDDKFCSMIEDMDGNKVNIFQRNIKSSKF